jgi:hypothetical protein
VEKKEVKRKIPLFPPFSKGEEEIEPPVVKGEKKKPPFRKGGQGGFDGRDGKD